MGYVCLVFGLLEFFEWGTGGKGLIGGFLFQHLKLDFALIQNPFIALYIILPAAWSESLRNQVRDGILSRSPLVLHPWSYRLSPWLQGLCYALLAHQGRQILESFFQGKRLVPNNYFFSFSSIIILIFFVQFILRNFPVVIAVNDRILGTETSGLYALKNDRFVLEEIPGITTSLKLLQGPCRWFKEKSSLWFIFAQNVCDFSGHNLKLKIERLQVDYSYWAIVTGNPSTIDTSKISLAGIESMSQLGQTIQMSLIPQFRLDFCEQPDYKDLKQELEEFFQTHQSLAQNPGEAAKQAVKVAQIRSKLKQLDTNLLNSVKLYQIYGGMYQIKFQPNEVMLSTETLQEIETFETKINELFEKEYQRVRDKQEYFVKVLGGVAEALEKIQLPASVHKEFIERLLTTIVPKSVEDKSMQNALSHQIELVLPKAESQEPG